MDTNFFANHAYVLLGLAMAFGAFGGMVLMACLTLASRADDALEREAAPRIAKPAAQCDCEWSDCCLHGGDVDSSHCPLRAAR